MKPARFDRPRGLPSCFVLFATTRRGPALRCRVEAERGLRSPLPALSRCLEQRWVVPTAFFAPPRPSLLQMPSCTDTVRALRASSGTTGTTDVAGTAHAQRRPKALSAFRSGLRRH